MLVGCFTVNNVQFLFTFTFFRERKLFLLRRMDDMKVFLDFRGQQDKEKTQRGAMK